MENVCIFATPAAYKLLVSPENEERVSIAVKSVAKAATDPSSRPSCVHIEDCPIGLTFLWANEAGQTSTILMFESEENYHLYCAFPEKFKALLKTAIPIHIV